MLDRLLEGRLRLGHRLAKRIEVDGDEVDGRDAVLLEGALVARVAAARQQPAVHLGMQRLHAAVHHFGEAGHPLDGEDGDAALPQRLGGAAGGHDLVAQGDQRPRELDDATFVGDGEQRPHQSSAMAWIRPPRLATSFKSTTSAGECE